jgi:hypothetical protein
MLDLRPLIARLVDDLLRVIRGASVEELGELLAPVEDPPRRRRRVRRSKPRPAAKPAARPKRRPAAPQVGAAPAPAPEPPTHAEITDPERLLAAAAVEALTRASVRPHVAPVAAEEPSPPSGQRPAAGANIALRQGESVARVSEHGGVVIRRKRAWALSTLVTAGDGGIIAIIPCDSQIRRMTLMRES